MARNIGKIFEDSIAKSVPDYAKLHRLPDPPQSFGGGNLRFSKKNPFDFFLWDSHRFRLYTLEMKTVAGKAISFERRKEDHGEIHYHQICGLNEWARYAGITAGFIVEFREIETTVFINILEFNRLLDLISKKSFNFDDLSNFGIQYFVIPQTKIRTRYTYDIDYFLTKLN